MKISFTIFDSRDGWIKIPPFHPRYARYNDIDELNKDIKGVLKIMETDTVNEKELKQHTCNCTCKDMGVDCEAYEKEMKEEPEAISCIEVDWLIFDVLILKAECLANPKLLEYCQHLEDQLFKLKNREAVLGV